MPTKTRLGNEIISLGMIGNHKKYEVLNTPKNPAYPLGDEFLYSDDFLNVINRVYSLKEILGDKRNEIASNDRISEIVMSSGTSCEGEGVLTNMLRNSALSGIWQPFIIDVPELKNAKMKTADEYLKRVDEIRSTHRGGGTPLGIVKTSNFALPVKYEQKVIVVPSQEFVEFIIDLVGK